MNNIPKVVKTKKIKKEKRTYTKRVKKPLERDGRNYFTDNTQNSILEYVDTDDRNIKQRLYIDEIEPVFKHLIENVVYTFGYSGLANLDSLKEECLMFLLTILAKYDKDKISSRTNTTSKAFAYITVITKNWLYHQSVKQQKMRERNIIFEDIYNFSGSDDNTAYISSEQYDDKLVEFNSAETNIEKQNFDKNFILFTDLCIEENLVSDLNLVKYISSIKELFLKSDNIDIFTKRSINHQIGEISNLSSSEIYICANKFKIKYKEFLNLWNNGEI